VREFSRRFGVQIIDGFGATEGGLAVTRTADAPAGAVGLAGAELRIVDDDGQEKARASFDADGVLIDPEGCVGEIVNVGGVGVFEGYYNNDEANRRATRNGWYWSGDLGYIDQAGYLYFAGRTADWIRVDGENFSSGPIETIIGRCPDVAMSAVYGVPDPEAGDRVMCALVMRNDATFEPERFAGWIDSQRDLAPKWKPTFVRVSRLLPLSPTNKVQSKVLVHEKFRLDRVGGDAIWVRGRGEAAFHPFTADECDALKGAFVSADRARFWDA
jgi:fatty-acyl-CoA synthase